MPKILTLILLITCLSACETKPLKTIQCSVLLEEQKCFCRNYEFTKERIGAIGNSWEEPNMDKCDMMVGFPLQEYPKVFKLWESVRVEANKPKRSKKENDEGYNR